MSKFLKIITVRICELCFGVTGAEKFRNRNMGTSKVSNELLCFDV